MDNKAPRSIAEDMSLQREDQQLTEEITSITLHIKTLVQNEENALTKFCDDFTSISNWIISQSGFIDTNTRSQIQQECIRLRNDAAKHIELINYIKAMTASEKETDQKKMNIKIEIEHDYDEQKRLVKVLHMPSDIVKLVKDIIKLVQKSEKGVREDIKIEEKTSKIVNSFEENINLIKTGLEEVLRSMGVKHPTPFEQKDLFKKLETLLSKVKNEIREFKCLDNLERVHLQLLLSLYKEETECFIKQRLLKNRELGGPAGKMDYIEEDFV
ncbi:MAG: hypothetical protein QXK37_03510 [Candidatus Woesearchaeota archaeon]